MFPASRYCITPTPDSSFRLWAQKYRYFGAVPSYYSWVEGHLPHEYGRTGLFVNGFHNSVSCFQPGRAFSRWAAITS